MADTRGRGELDVLYSNYHGETTRTVGLFIYQPDEEAQYSTSRRLVLPAYSSSANFVADLDQDGFSDIVVVNHTGPTIALGLGQKTGNHSVGSFVYWGAADGFTLERRSTVPSHGPHKIMNAELGDILRRRPYETYTSAWQEVSLSAGDYALVLEGEFLGGASCRAELQMEPVTPDDWTKLSPVSGTADTLQFRFTATSPVRELRYRLDLDTGGAGTGPIVRSITLSKLD